MTSIARIRVTAAAGTFPPLGSQRQHPADLLEDGRVRPAALSRSLGVPFDAARGNLEP